MTDMIEMLQPSFDGLVASLPICLTLRDGLHFTLSDHIAMPRGWLIETGRDT